jgi:hypothetical protein
LGNFAFSGNYYSEFDLSFYNSGLLLFRAEAENIWTSSWVLTDLIFHGTVLPSLTTSAHYYGQSAGGVIGQANGQFLNFAVSDVIVSNLSSVHPSGVPAPIIGAGLPGMVSVLTGGGLLAWWRRKRHAQAVG